MSNGGVGVGDDRRNSGGIVQQPSSVDETLCHNGRIVTIGRVELLLELVDG